MTQNAADHIASWCAMALLVLIAIAATERLLHCRHGRRASDRDAALIAVTLLLVATLGLAAQAVRLADLNAAGQVIRLFATIALGVLALLVLDRLGELTSRPRPGQTERRHQRSLNLLERLLSRTPMSTRLPSCPWFIAVVLCLLGALVQGLAAQSSLGLVLAGIAATILASQAATRRRRA